MFFIDLNNIDIPYESAEQSLLTKDYPLLKRRLDQIIFFSKIKVRFSVFYNVFEVMQLLD